MSRTIEDHICATCNEVTATRGEYCDDCDRQHREDQYWENRMDWEREKQLFED